MADPLPYASPGTRARRPHLSWADWLVWLVALGGLAAGVWWFVFDERFPMTVIVVNETTAPIPRVRFTLDGANFTIDNVAAGATVRREVTLRGSGTLYYTVLPSSASYPTGTICSHLDGDCRGAVVGVRVRGGAAEPFGVPSIPPGQ